MKVRSPKSHLDRLGPALQRQQQVPTVPPRVGVHVGRSSPDQVLGLHTQGSQAGALEEREAPLLIRGPQGDRQVRDHGIEPLATLSELLLDRKVGSDVARDSLDRDDPSFAVADRDRPVLDVRVGPIPPAPASDDGQSRCRRIWVH